MRKHEFLLSKSKCYYEIPVEAGLRMDLTVVAVEGKGGRAVRPQREQHRHRFPAERSEDSLDLSIDLTRRDAL